MKKFFNKVLYWSPYIPIIGFLVVNMWMCWYPESKYNMCIFKKDPKTDEVNNYGDVHLIVSPIVSSVVSFLIVCMLLGKL